MPSILQRLTCVWNCSNFRTHKGGVKIHTLYDVETQVPAFIHITEAKINDVKAMDVIPYESGSFYVFDRAYNDYHRLYKIHMMDSFFVVRAKTNIKAKVLKWKRRLPKNTLIPQHYYKIFFLSTWATKSCSGFCHVRGFT